MKNTEQNFETTTEPTTVYRWIKRKVYGGITEFHIEKDLTVLFDGEVRVHSERSKYSCPGIAGPSFSFTDPEAVRMMAMNLLRAADMLDDILEGVSE